MRGEHPLSSRRQNGIHFGGLLSPGYILLMLAIARRRKENVAMPSSAHPYAEYDRQFWLATDSARTVVPDLEPPLTFKSIEKAIMPEADFSLRSLHAALHNMLSNGELVRTKDMKIQLGELQPVGS